jgi:predicted nucleotidyltransferase
MTACIEIDREQIADFCRRWRITEFSLFGSVLRDDFRPDSDVDVLVAFEPGAHPGPFGLTDMEEELGRMFDRKLDVVTRRAVEENPNYIVRRHILQHLEPIFAA